MRKYAFLNILILVVLLLSACGTPEPTEVPATEAPTEEAPAATAVPETEEPEPVSKYQEAPMLAAKVDAGELPPVDERLPANPMVIAPLVEQGQYGGELKYGFTGDPTWGGVFYVT